MALSKMLMLVLPLRLLQAPAFLQDGYKEKLVLDMAQVAQLSLPDSWRLRIVSLEVSPANRTHQDACIDPGRGRDPWRGISTGSMPFKHARAHAARPHARLHLHACSHRGCS